MPFSSWKHLKKRPRQKAVKYGLRAFAALGILDKLSGILFGRPGGQIPIEKHAEYDKVLFQVVAEEEGLTDLPIITGMDFGHTDPHAEYDKVLLQVISEEEGLTGLPIITGMDFGHTDPMFVLPYGIQAEIDCENQRFAILENAVTA